MDEKIGFPKQRKYKIEIVKKDYKVKEVSEGIGCNYSLLSQYINGRMHMPEIVKENLDEFLGL